MPTVAEQTATVTFDTTWTTAVRRVSDQAQARLPEALHGRVQRGTALALTGGVWFEPDGHTCLVRGSKGAWYSANGSCPCEDYQRAPEQLCKHRLARGIYLRASELLREGVRPVSADVIRGAITTGDSTTPSASPVPQATAAGITADDDPPGAPVPQQYVVQIQGKPYIKYTGLLAMAHARGLVELTATWTYNDAELSLAHAIAIFKDGRRFEESGDAAPSTVMKQVAPHFRRVALTRSKSRTLRDALNIDMVAVEELGDE